MANVLIVHGDAETRHNLATMVEKENFTVLEAEDAETGLRYARALKSQLILLDLPLPGINAVELCMHLRASKIMTPIITLCNGNDVDQILLLECGADDCLLKPFSMRELLARIRALLRRTLPGSSKTIRFAEVEVDPVRRAITRSGKNVSVTRCEYNLLLFFLQNADRPLTRDVLLNSVWGYEQYPNTRTVDTHVMKLRSKLEPDRSTPRHFITIHGIGYRFMM